MRFGIRVVLTALIFGSGVTANLFAAEADWPQWRGADRTNISKETGLLPEWPEKGPDVVWTIKEIGEGYGTVSVVGDKIFVQGTQGDKSVVFGLNRAAGKILWTTILGPRLDQDQGPGPRSTPTIENGFAYCLNENGDLACLKTDDGSIVWEKNILSEFEGDNPVWHISESPLIDGENLIVTPGGKKGGIVALEKKTGKMVWASKDMTDKAGYASAIRADLAGIPMIIQFTHQGGVGVRADNGNFLWRYDNAANETANCSTPVFKYNKVFFSSAYDTGSGAVDLIVTDGKIEAKEAYFNKDLMNHHGGLVLLGGHIYGFSGQPLVCLDFNTGATVWRDRSVGKGAVTYADGRLYLLGENLTMGLAEASPKGYVEKGRFRIEDQGRPSWAHPVVCAGKLYIRNQAILTCYDIKAKETASK